MHISRDFAACKFLVLTNDNVNRREKEEQRVRAFRGQEKLKNCSMAYSGRE